MMMSKPAPSASEEEEKSASNATATATAKPQGQGTVADLERRLAILSTAEEAAGASTEQTIGAPVLQAPAAAAPPAAKSGKNALLVSTVKQRHILLFTFIAASERSLRSNRNDVIRPEKSRGTIADDTSRLTQWRNNLFVRLRFDAMR
jgi:hypothetical protein